MTFLAYIGAFFLAISILLGAYDYKYKKAPIDYPSWTPRMPSPYRKDIELQTIQPVTKKSAYVTGANGFLGTNLVEELLKDGWQVTATHRKGSNIDILKSLDRFGPGKLSIKTADVTDVASIDESMPEGVGVVFHVAAVLEFWKPLDDLVYRVNVLGGRFS
ncbi:hypothetical protein AAMO2058_000157500 [Amorphochlora amoebiformis]